MASERGAALGPLDPPARREKSYALRVKTAAHYLAAEIPVHRNNGDEQRYAAENYYASYSKALPHDGNGEVEPDAYRSLLHALRTGAPAAFEAIPLGCAAAQVLLTDPQAGLAFDLEGIDAHQVTQAPCYAFNSAGEIGEIAENYWLALARDVPFSEYEASPITRKAVADLNKYGVFNGPRDPASGEVTTGTLFRGPSAGDAMGPYLSQFFVRDVPYGSQKTPALLAFAVPEQDYMTTEEEYLAVQNGCKAAVVPLPLANPRRMTKGRDLANYVHIDELFQAYLNACLLLITPQNRGGFGAPLGPGNPYVGSKTQTGFGTLGEPNFKTLVAEVATRALKAVWFQKWFVHRRLRPEVFAGRLHWQLAKGRAYDFDAAELAKLQAGPLSEPAIEAAQYFLPMAFPEGSPTHPAYGAGHATVAGACVTVLKALFKQDQTLAGLGIVPLEPDAAGTGLQPYAGADADQLTIGGELNKLASNVGIARNFAGVHWRSDYTASVRLGEEVALHFLSDYVRTYNERVSFEMTLFDGTTVTVHN